jgi:hypothetical protein
MKKEDIRKAFEEAFNIQKPQIERKFKGVRGCITYGHEDIMDFSHCGNKECLSCNLVTKAFREEVERQTFKPYEKL